MPVNPEPDLPYFEAGQKIYADDFNMLVDVIRKMRVTAVAPLESKIGPGGTVIRWNGSRVCRYAKATSTIGALSGTTLGSGTIQLYYRAPGSASLSALSDATGLTCYNITGSPVASGTLCIVEWVDDAWVVIVADCSSGS